VVVLPIIFTVLPDFIEGNIRERSIQTMFTELRIITTQAIMEKENYQKKIK
jgi:hypothetical protein